MIRYLLHGLAVHFRAGRILFLLTLIGVALGVASILSIQLILASSTGAFEGSLRAVHGDSDLSVLGLDSKVPSASFPVVLSDPHVAAAFPLARVQVALAGEDDFYLEAIGVDMTAMARLPIVSGAETVGDPLFTPGWTAVSPELAEQFGWRLGQSIRVSSGSRLADLYLGALVDFQRVTPLAGTRIVVMDLAQLQQGLAEAGFVHRIDIELVESADIEAAQQSLQARLGQTLRVRTPAQRRDENAGLMGAFRLNLTALSWISVIVGTFLVYASTRAALLRRRAEFGLMRSIGATRAQVFGQILGEIALLALMGVVLGLPLGIVVAQANLQRVSATLSNLYLLQEVERLQLDLGTIAMAVGAGLLGAVLGAAAPALEIAGKNPRRLLASFAVHERMAGFARPMLIVGIAVVIVVFGLGWTVGAEWRPAGFAMALSLLIAIPLVTPAVLLRTTRSVRTSRFGLRWGFHALGLQMQTTAFAVAALAVTVSMLVGITVMIGSFRKTVEIWIDSSLQADIYITTESWRRARSDAEIDAGLVQAIRGRATVADAYSLRQADVFVGERKIVLSGTDMQTEGTLGGMALLDGDLADARAAVVEDGAALITEPLARKEKLGIGDRLRVRSSVGPIEFPIVAVAYDYSSEAGGAMISMERFEEIFGAGEPSNIALLLKPGIDPAEEVGRLREEYSELPLEIRDNKTIRAEVVRIFDETFAVTRILQAISLAIALCGITLTLLVLARERVAELALYRALGATRAQILRVFVGKGLGIGAVGLLLGSAGGVALAAILIYRINRDFFGWTIALHTPWPTLASQLLTILAAAALASLYPALRASRTPATELSRENL